VKKNHHSVLLKIYHLSFCFLVIFYGNLFGQSKTNEWLNKINQAINETDKYDQEKIVRIGRLRGQVDNGETKTLFDKYLRLYEEFSVFNFDSAYFYANKLHETALRANDESLVTYAKIKEKFVLLSSGMYKEVFDSLNNISPQGLDNSKKAEYYTLKSRSLFDLAEYNHDKFFTDLYNKEADLYIDSSLMVLPPTSFQFHYYSGLRELRANRVNQATFYFRKIIDDSSLSLHDKAILYSTYSDIYTRKRQSDSTFILLAMAVIADIQSSTKETSAIFNAATWLFERGDLKNATTFIQKASSDAKAYGARQRMLQLSNLLPLIESERLNMVQRQKSNVILYAMIITGLLLILVVMIIVIFRQVKRLKIQQKEISKKNISLSHLVEERERLMMEIHHRVKNNLQTIISLLESQSAYLENDALAAIRDTQHRIFAMSLIHQKLYQPEKDVSRIDMSVYIHEMIIYLSESFEIHKKIKFQTDLQRIDLGIQMAVPMGLILNEAITNAVKYAFPDMQHGTVTISLKRKGNGMLVLTVFDDGVGLPKDFDITRVKSLGMKLMKGLSDDLAAAFRVESIPGTKISVEFRNNKAEYFE